MKACVIGLAVFVGASLLHMTRSPAADVVVEHGLQRVLHEYLSHIGNTQAGQDGKLDRILEGMNALEVSVCLFAEWLREIEVSGRAQSTKLEYLLEDRLRAHAQTVSQTEQLLASRLGVAGDSDAETRQALRDLAVQVAANELSLAAIREEVLPDLFEKTQANTRNITEVQTKIAFLDLKYRADFKSLCDRMDSLEAEVSELRRNGGGVAQAAWEQPAPTPTPTPVELRPVPQPSPHPAHHWQPMAYVTAATLCRNAVLKQRDYVYHARVVTSQGVIAVRYVGDIYIDCSGKVVMLLE